MVTVARGRLAMLVGLGGDEEVAPAGAPEGIPAATGTKPTLADAEAGALEARTELDELDLRIRQAKEGEHFAWLEFLPQISVIGSWEHNAGSAFAQTDSWFVGLFATWDLWDWGTRYASVNQARARTRKARAGRDKARDGIRLETRAAHVAVDTATEALAVAEKAVVQAQENFRIEGLRFEAQDNTTFDVIDAEALLTQARAQRETALFDYLIADAALRRAMGQDLGQETGRTP
jgi:outer membrane protein